MADLPLCSINLGDEETCALIDSGSFVSMIDRQLFENMSVENILGFSTNKSVSMTGLSGEEIKNFGKALLRVKIPPSFNHVFTFFLVEHLDDPFRCILGNNFLTSYQLTYFNLTLHVTDIWQHIHSDLGLNNMTLGTSLEMLPPSHSRTVTVSLLKAHINDIQSRAKWHYRTVVPGVSVSVCVLSVLAIMYCMYRYRCSRQPTILPLCLPTPPKTGSDTMDKTQDASSPTTNRPDFALTDRPPTQLTQLRPSRSEPMTKDVPGHSAPLPWLTRQQTAEM